MTEWDVPGLSIFSAMSSEEFIVVVSPSPLVDHLLFATLGDYLVLHVLS